MRDRLVELFKDFSFKCVEPCDKRIKQSENIIVVNCETCKKEQLADHLLANGVIVPPCRVGDKVCWHNIAGKIIDAEITRIGFTAKTESWKENYACNVECPHFHSEFNHCVFFLDLATGMCDTTSYNHNIKRFCRYADENIILGEYRTDDVHPTEKGGVQE